MLAGVSFALAAQSSGYYAVACAVIAVVVALVRWRAFCDRRVLAAALLAALLGRRSCSFPTSTPSRALREREGQALERDPALSETMAFQPGRDLTSHGYLYGALLGRDGEHLFPGSACPWSSPAWPGGAGAPTRGSLGHGGGAPAVSLGPRLSLLGTSIALPYAALFALPPLDSMRHPYTFAAVATFLLAVLAGLGWSSLAVSRRRGAGGRGRRLAVLETLGPGLR